MFSKFFGESTKKEKNLNLTNSTSQFNGNQSTLLQLKGEEQSNSNTMNSDMIESDIDKIERKINDINNPEIFTRENQISKPVDEIIEVPKIKITDEKNILSEDKKQNKIKQKLREKEAEQDKEKRIIENDIEKIKKKKLSVEYKTFNLKIKKKKIKKIGKILLLIILIYSGSIGLILLIDRILGK